MATTARTASNTTVGITNGRSIGHASAQPGLQPATIVERFDNRRFFDFYVDGLTSAVPVAQPSASTEEGK